MYGRLRVLADNAVLIRNRWESRRVEMRMNTADQAYVVRTVDNDIVPVHELSTPLYKIALLALTIKKLKVNSMSMPRVLWFANNRSRVLAG
jgi:hypothetical protein